MLYGNVTNLKGDEHFLDLQVYGRHVRRSSLQDAYLHQRWAPRWSKHRLDIDISFYDFKTQYYFDFDICGIAHRVQRA